MLFNKITDFYTAAMQLTYSCVVALDTSGKILEFQTYLEKLSPETADACIGKNWFNLFCPVKDVPNSQDFFEEDILQQNQVTPTQKILTVYENELFMEWTFLNVDQSDAASSGILGVGIDVTKHIELEIQLQHADRLSTVGQLAAGIAHEINGPLNNILGYAQLSSKQMDLPEQVYQDLDNIIRFSLHVREIVKKVMLFSRQVPPKHENVDLNKVIKESLYFTEPVCRQNQIDICQELEEGLPRITGDFSQLRQVVVNLIVNAVQSIGEKGGKIIIKTTQDSKKRVNIIVQDSGVGMPPEIIEQCFIPFFTTKDVDQGTGLGLSVAHGIIKSHHGIITADSIMGEGSRFHVVFPVNSEKGEKNV